MVFAATILALAAAGAARCMEPRRQAQHRPCHRRSRRSSSSVASSAPSCWSFSRDLPAAAWRTGDRHGGLVHVPYLLLLAAAYEHGDFSVAYPVARGSGAVLAALGGVVLLDDDLSAVRRHWRSLTVAAGMLPAGGRCLGRPAADGARSRCDDRCVHGQRQPCREVVRPRPTRSPRTRPSGSP